MSDTVSDLISRTFNDKTQYSNTQYSILILNSILNTYLWVIQYQPKRIIFVMVGKIFVKLGKHTFSFCNLQYCRKHIM